MSGGPGPELDRATPQLYSGTVHFDSGVRVSNRVTYSYARQNLASLLDQAEDEQEPVYIARRNRPDMVLMPAAEYRAVEETAHLLRSPENARRLLSALQKAMKGDVPPSTLADLRRDLGLEEEEAGK